MGEFFLIEFIEEFPLIITTFGMASKLVKYVYSKRVQREMDKENNLNANQIIKEEDKDLSFFNESMSKTEMKSKS